MSKRKHTHNFFVVSPVSVKRAILACVWQDGVLRILDGGNWRSIIVHDGAVVLRSVQVVGGLLVYSVSVVLIALSLDKQFLFFSITFIISCCSDDVDFYQVVE